MSPSLAVVPSACPPAPAADPGRVIGSAWSPPSGDLLRQLDLFFRRVQHRATVLDEEVSPLVFDEASSSTSPPPRFPPGSLRSWSASSNVFGGVGCACHARSIPPPETLVAATQDSQLRVTGGCVRKGAGYEAMDLSSTLRVSASRAAARLVDRPCACRRRDQTPQRAVIAVDDLRPQLGVTAPVAQTPNLDKLAASGLLFTRAYFQQAVCSPSRTSLLTGRRAGHDEDLQTR